MKLSEEDIILCLEEHKNFRTKFITEDCCVSFNDFTPTSLGGKGHSHPKGNHTMVMKEFLDSEFNHVSPNREKFFESVASYFFEKEKTGIIGLEIGVATGTNAERINKFIDLSEMWLIDPWASQNNRAADRGDNNGTHNKAFEETNRRFGTNDKFKIIKNFAADVVDQFSDEYFDFIYIDGDHSYEGCKKDLDLYYPKLKEGGFFGGHDFTGSPKSLRKKGFGVQKAACEFLTEHNKKLQFITTCVETKKPNIILPFDWGFIK